MVVRFTTTYAISAYYNLICEFESCSWWGILHTILCDKLLQQVGGFLLSIPISSTNKTDHQDITEISLKVVLNTITLTPLYD
jgi:hypothetical protein